MKNKTMARSGGTSENNKYDKKKEMRNSFIPKFGLTRFFCFGS